MNLNEIYKISKGIIINGKLNSKKISEVKLNSKNINKNDVFICIKGKNDDGHNYIEKVLKKCICIIVEKDIIINSNILVIKVKSTLEFLYSLGLYIRNKYINIPLIGITGSVGKTTTKELLVHILKNKYNVLYSRGNNNNNIGVPLTLTRYNDHNLIILELGMNHLKEIEKLSYMVKPNTAIITNIGTSHIGNLGSKKNIYKAKMEIVKGMDKGNLILNINDNYLKKYKNKLLNIYYNDFQIKNVICDNYLYFTLIYNNKEHNIKFSIPNISLIDNLLLVIKTCLLYKMSIQEIICYLETFETLDGRNKYIYLNNNITLIDDCYNASYESIVSSIKMLKNHDNIIILGDILELGKYSAKIHKKLGKKIKEKTVLTVGKNMLVTSKYCKGINFKNNIELINYISKLDLKNKHILLKGSRGMHLEEIKKYIVNNCNK